MTITFKLFAGLSEHLPEHARRNSAEIELMPNETVDQLIDRQQVPRKDVHLVLVNGTRTPIRAPPRSSGLIAISPLKPLGSDP